MIYIHFNNVKDKIDQFIGQDLGNYGKHNSSSSTKRPKFISLSVNNRLGYSEELTTMMELIQFNVDDT